MQTLVRRTLVKGSASLPGGTLLSVGVLVVALAMATSKPSSMRPLGAIVLCPAGAGVDADHADQIEARDDIGQWRQLRQQGGAPEPVVGEQPDLAAFDPGLEIGIGRPQHLHVTAEQRRHRLAGAPIGNVGDVELQRRLHRLHGEMMRAADARRAVVDLTRLRLHVVDELLQRLDRRLRAAPRETAACAPAPRSARNPSADCRRAG